MISFSFWVCSWANFPQSSDPTQKSLGPHRLTSQKIPRKSLPALEPEKSIKEPHKSQKDRGPKLNTNIFSQTFRPPPDIPAKSRDIPPKCLVSLSPGFRGTYRTFWPPPLHMEDSQPTGRYGDQKVWVWVSFFLPKKETLSRFFGLFGARGPGRLFSSSSGVSPVRPDGPCMGSEDCNSSRQTERDGSC